MFGCCNLSRTEGCQLPKLFYASSVEQMLHKRCYVSNLVFLKESVSLEESFPQPHVSMVSIHNILLNALSSRRGQNQRLDIVGVATMSSQTSEIELLDISYV